MRESPSRAATKKRKSMPELVVLSREEVERYEPRKDEICISISDPFARPAILSREFRAVLRLYFTDVVERGDPSDVLFAERDAAAISQFIDAHFDARRIVLHCNMGMSRSPGVALGLCDRHGWATAELERKHPGWNRLVRSVMSKVATSK